MRIEEFAITRYGPLAETGVVRPAPFSLFYAPNEEGKTLLVEALARMLLEKEARPIAGIGRVEEKPEGHLVLRTADAEHKLPDDGSVLDLCTLKPLDWRSIFIIRNSDLVLPEETGLYTSVADRLTGLKTRDIERVSDKLRDIAHLTPTLQIANRQEEGKLRDRLEDARALIEELDELHEEIETEGLEDIEQELVAVSEDIERIDGELAALEEARKRDAFRAGSKALDKLRESLDKAEELEGFSRQKLETWEGLRESAAETEQKITDLERQARDLGARMEELETRQSEVQRELDVLQKRADDAEELKLQMREHDRMAEALRRLAPAERYLRYAGLGLAALTALALLGLAAAGGAWPIALAALFGIPALGCGAAVLWLALRRGRTDARLAALRRAAADAALEGETTEDIRRSIRRLEEEREKRSRAAQSLRAKQDVAQENLRDIRETGIPQARKQLESDRRAIADLRTESGLSDPAEYRERVREKEELQKEVSQQAAVLESRLGTAAERPEENLEYWQERLRPLEQHAEAAAGVEFSEQRVQELQKRRGELVDHRRQLQQSLQGLRRKLSEVARRANEILLPEADYLHCQTLRDLETIHRRLDGFIEEHETRADLARAAIAVFEKINREEEDKVARLFGPDSAVSRRFAAITDGLYRAVLYERAEEGGRRISVETEDGSVLDARRLSGGAYDQLYLAVRLALGETLLGEEKGFFIMDDPFVKADAQRLRRQVEMLLGIVEQGWQVLYFTAKEEVRDALAEQIEQERVEQLAAPGVRRD